MALTREQRRRMTRSLARMRNRQGAAALVTPESDAGAGYTTPGTMTPTPSQAAIDHVAARMWWAAQSQPANADRIMAARATMIAESALA